MKHHRNMEYALSLAIIASLFLSTPDSFAQTTAAKKKKKTVADVLKNIDSSGRGNKFSITKSSTALPESQKSQAAPPPRSLYEVKPPRSQEIFHEGSDEEKLEEITDRSIQELYNLSQKYGKSKNRGELWLRLAEQYVEKAKFIEYRLQKDYDKRVELYLSKKAPKPKLDLSKSREYNQKAISLYEWFLHDFPRDPKTDQALFFLGYNYIELDQIKKGVTYYERLTKEHPDSTYVSEAYFALGEFYFDNDKWQDAYKQYNSVLKNKRARLYTFALYKMAWCLYRIGRAGQGLNLLEQVVKLSRAPRESGRVVSKIRLGSEALRDIVLFYGDVGDYKKAPSYFLTIGGEKAQAPMLEKLAYYYADSGKREEAMFIFKQLLQENPTAPKAFDYQYQIVSILSTSKEQKLYRSELYQWIEQYGPDSEWARANANDKKLMEDSYNMRESAMRGYTVLLHKNGQNSGKRSDLVASKDAYGLYLSKFDNSPKAPEMHFFYGELLYQLGDYANAAGEYRLVIQREPKGKYFELAALNTLLAIEKGLKTDEQIRQAVGDSMQPVPFTEVENNFIVAADVYMKNFPRGEKVVDIKFKIGRLHYTYNHFDDALRFFKEIVDHYPNTPFAVYSANLILDIYNIRKDYDNLAKEGTRFMRNRALTNQGFQTDVRDVVEKANFKKGLELEASKQYEASAKAFSEFAKNHPGSNLAPAAAYNAGINYERAQKVPEAIVMYRKVEASHGKGQEKYRTKSILLLGRLYEQTAQYDKAAVEFERYARENPKDKVTPDLYYNIAVIYEGEKQYYKAMNAYQKYYDLSRKPDRPLALYQIALIHEKMQHYKAAQEEFEKFLRSGSGDGDKLVEAQFKIADLYEKRGYRTDADKAHAKVISLQRRLGRGNMWAAESKFRLTEKTYSDFTSIRIPANPKRQGEAIKQKLQFLTQLGNNYAAIIKYDDGNMVIASLTRLGQAYDHLGRAIQSAPVPTGLTKEEADQYKKGVEGKAKEFSDKAVENFTTAINKSFEINYYNNWTKVALAAMTQYQPEKYKKPVETAIPVAKTDEMELY